MRIDTDVFLTQAPQQEHPDTHNNSAGSFRLCRLHALRAFLFMLITLALAGTNAYAYTLAELHRMTESDLREAVADDPDNIERRLALVRKLGQTKQAEALTMLGRIDKNNLTPPQRLYYEAQTCEIKIRSGDITTANASCNRASELLEQGTGHAICEAIGLNALGTLYSRRGTPELALDEFERGLQLIAGGKDEALSVTILHNRGVALTLYGLTDLAIEAFEAADSLKDILPDDDPVPTILAYNLGYLQAQRGEHEAALRSYAIATEWLNETKQYARAYIAATEVALSLSAIGKHQEALETLAPWLDQSDAKVTPDSEAQAYLAVGNAHLGMGNITAAREAMLKGISIARESANPARLRDLSLAYAASLIDEGNYDTAISDLESLIDMLRDNNTNDGLGRAHELLANAYAEIGDFASAWKHSTKAAEMQRISQTQAFDRRLASLRISNELDVKDQQLTLALAREATAVTSQRLAELIQIATVTGVLISLIVTYLLFSRRQKQQEASIQREVAVELEREVDIRTQEAELELDKRHAAETERANLELRLVKDDKLRSIGQLTGGVAHDFNNLMTVVLLSAEMLEPDLNEEQKKLVNDIIGATQSGRAITRGLLAYARQQTLTPTSIELGQYLRTSVSLFRQSLNERVELVTDLPDSSDPHLIEVDPGQLTTCLLNLVINAREAIPESGQVTISVRRSGDTIAIAVSDTGNGMTEQQASNATEPFFTTKEVSQGAGLGLSMVDGFVSQSGGTITIETKVGVGTTVTLTFKASVAATPTERTKPVVPTGATNKNILIVEDEAGIREVARVALSKEGYNVNVAASGDEAKLLMPECSPLDLLITDLVMPGSLSGEALIEVARDFYPNLPVILMSGYATDVPKGFSFLPKPFSLLDLKNLVSEELSHKPNA